MKIGRSVSRTRSRLVGDEGTALVELALVLPLLLLVVFGIVEFGYGYGQSLDVKHGAREASRLAAVNFRTSLVTGTAQSDQIIAAACDRMQIVGGTANTTVSLAFVGTGSGQKDRGEFARVTVSRPLVQITGFLDFALDGVTLKSEVETRLETDATWDARTGGC
jgi:Flp pilus assembly protein TadG